MVVGLAAVPSPASAQQCVVTVTVAGGQQMNFTVNVPAATYPHGWREVRLEDANGYMFAVGVATT